MKKLLLLATMALAAVSAFAQGTVNFANIGAGGLNAPVTNSVDGTRLSGATWVSQLYWGPAGSSAASLSPLTGSAPATFNTGAQAGYFTGGQRTFTVPGGTTVTLQVRAWNIAAGATYEDALANSAGIVGTSNPIQFNLTTPPATPANMIGLQGFSVVPVPEPSSIALGLLGLGAVALFRRRK